MFNRSRTLIALVGVCALLGCGDSPGENDVPLALPEWTVTPDLRIGSLTDPDQALTAFNANQLAVADDGTMFIGQSQDGQIRVYNQDGALLRVIGRSGEGPGEFARLMTIGLQEGELYGVDLINASVEFFTPGGEYLRTKTFRESPESESRPSPPYTLFPDGTGIASPGRPVGLDSTFTYLRVDSLGVVLDTLLEFPSSRVSASIETGTTRASIRRPFGGPTPFAVSPDGQITWTVDDESTTGYRLIKRSISGDTLFVGSFEVSPIEVPDSVRQREDSIAMSQAQRAFQDRSQARSFVDEFVPIPKFYPSARAARPSEDGGVWVQLAPNPSAEHQVWVLHDAEAAPQAKLHLPASINLVLIRDSKVWGIEFDELDLPYLVRFRIARG